MSAPFQDITITSSEYVERDQAIVLCVGKDGFQYFVVNYGDLNDYFASHNVIVVTISTERWAAMSAWNKESSEGRTFH